MKKFFVFFAAIFMTIALGTIQPAVALVEIPEGATVTSATLSLYVSIPANQTVNVHAINEEWTETGVTWATRPDFNPAVVDSFVTDDSDWQSADVTAIVQAWIEGAPNYGFLLEQGLTAYSKFYSSENSNIAGRPNLEITFYTTDPANPTTVSIQRPGSEQDDVKDAYIRALNPDYNGGNSSNLYTGLISGYEKQTLIRFEFDTVIYCGDGIINGESEACDDGNNVNGDGCAADCTIEPFCGDGNIDVGEECDDGNDIDGDGCSNCTLDPYCGDGNLDAGEECDDGNDENGDGCSFCTIDPQCGNGSPDAGEECDDGNDIDGDGCSSCTLDPYCGDGNLDVGEACDDGNNVNGDGCSLSCSIEKARIGNRVWEDVNANGIQDSEEKGIAGVTVNLYSCDDTLITTKTTNRNGKYRFGRLLPDDYYVQFVLPDGYKFSPINAGADNVDSDARPCSGKTVCTTLDPRETDLTWDAGLVKTIAPKEVGIVRGDPHFFGGDGGTFDYHGYEGGIYSLLSDQDLDFNVQFGDSNLGTKTIVVKSKINIYDSGVQSGRILLNKAGKAFLNGVGLSYGDDITLSNGTRLRYIKMENVAHPNRRMQLLSVDSKRKALSLLKIWTVEGYFIEELAVEAPHNRHIDIGIKTPRKGVNSDGILPDGLLGQTFDEDDVPMTATDFDGSDYEVETLGSRF